MPEQLIKSDRDVLDFWFVQHGQEDWFGARPEFDAAIARLFTPTHAAVGRGEAAWWRQTPDGRVAEIIVLDQFSRQLFRKRPEAFATDAMALELAQQAVEGGDDMRIEPRRRSFLYLPFMHSEDMAVHERSLHLFEAFGEPEFLKFELAHQETLKRFGRYPRRNEALGRPSTPAEIEYINSGTGMF